MKNLRKQNRKMLKQLRKKLKSEEQTDNSIPTKRIKHENLVGGNSWVDTVPLLNNASAMEVTKLVKDTSLNENREGKRSFLSSEPGTSYLNFSPVTKVQTGIDKVLEQVIIATDINPDSKTEINFSFPQENALFIHPRSVEFFSKLNYFMMELLAQRHHQT